MQLILWRREWDFVDLRHRWGPADQRQKLRASLFLIAEYPPDGETGGAATEAQILQGNESRGIHIPRGALNNEGPNTKKSPPIRANGRAIRTGYLVS